ncbi:hypothetical protein Tco_0811478 [Tanacetum coccineum]
MCGTRASAEQKQNMEDTMLDLLEICRQKELYCMHNNVEDLIESALNSKLLLINLNSQRLNKEEQEVKNIAEPTAKHQTRISPCLKNFKVTHKESIISLNKTPQISPVNAITLDLPTEEPEDSLIMGNEELSTIPEKESDEFIKSSVEDLIPIPRESEDYICDVNPLFHEVLENIECKDSYDSNFDESTFLVTPLFDSNKDEFFTPGDDIEFLLHRDPSTPTISIVSILEGFTDEPPLKENDDLFDLESKANDWKKILYDAPIDDLMTEDKWRAMRTKEARKDGHVAIFDRWINPLAVCYPRFPQLVSEPRGSRSRMLQGCHVHDGKKVRAPVINSEDDIMKKKQVVFSVLDVQTDTIQVVVAA